MTALEDAYAELVRKYQRLPVQNDDITCKGFGERCGMSSDAARNALEKEAEAGKLERLKRTSSNGRPMWVYRIKGE